MQPKAPEPIAIVYCQGAFGTTNGKTAHGLVRRSRRYKVASVVDERWSGQDAGQVLDGRPAGIPVVADLRQALNRNPEQGPAPTHFVFGVAPDGGRLEPRHRGAIVTALEAGLHVVAGLHDFLGDDPELQAIAARTGASLTDVRRTPDRADLHFFSGKIEEVAAYKVALLGTDSAVGKRTTAWLLVDSLAKADVKAELVGTGQTAWLQGARHGIILDSLINDFVAGEIEHAVHSAWQDGRPEVIVLEGQGSLLHPAYPGGFELLAAGRPDVVVLQHAPGRRDYDGFPGWPVHPLERQIEAIQVVSQCPVVAITVNHEDLNPEQVGQACAQINQATGLPALDPLVDQGAGLASLIREGLNTKASSR